MESEVKYSWVDPNSEFIDVTDYCIRKGGTHFEKPGKYLFFGYKVVITKIDPSGKRMMKNGKEASFSKRYYGYFVDAHGDKVGFEDMRPVKLKNMIDPNIRFK
jgi:hypothetical protein